MAGGNPARPAGAEPAEPAEDTGEADGEGEADADADSGADSEAVPEADSGAASDGEEAAGAAGTTDGDGASGAEAGAEGAGADEGDADVAVSPSGADAGEAEADAASDIEEAEDENEDEDAGTGAGAGAVEASADGPDGTRSGDTRAGELPPSDVDVARSRAATPPPPPSAPPAAPVERPGPLVKPLVSDIPAEWPEGSQKSRQGSSSGPLAFGTPGRPTRADSAPPAQAPGARPRSVPLPPAQPPAGVPGKPGKQDAPGSRSGGTSQDDVVGPEGTRGMPVPPVPDKQPLKLLAELTNTPPPAETTLRTVVRRFKIWTPLVVLLAIVFVVVQAVRPLPSPKLALTTVPSYTFAGTPLPQTMPWPTEGQSVAEVEGLGSLGVHGTQSPVPIASLTKVMTAYVVLHDHPLTGKQGGPMITVDAQAAQEASSEDQSTAPVKAGQRFDERQMLQLLLIPSGNNIARLLARWDSGTQDAFVAKMTKAAKQLGMTHTTYTGASGIEETTVSTAVDQLDLARQVMKNDVFRSVVAMPNIDIPGVGRIYNNNNDLVKFGVVGIKTGSSTPAGGALMWAAHKTVDGKQQLILGVVLQQHGGSTVNDSLQTALQRSQTLIDSVQAGLDSATIVKKGTVVGKVDDGLGGTTPVVVGKDLAAIGWPGMKKDLTLTPDDGGLPHNAPAGTKVGTLSFGTGAARTEVPVVLQSDLSAPGFGAKLTRF